MKINYNDLSVALPAFISWFHPWNKWCVLSLRNGQYRWLYGERLTRLSMFFVSDKCLFPNYNFYEIVPKPVLSTKYPVQKLTFICLPFFADPFYFARVEYESVPCDGCFSDSDVGNLGWCNSSSLSLQAVDSYARMCSCNAFGDLRLPSFSWICRCSCSLACHHHSPHIPLVELYQGWC